MSYFTKFLKKPIFWLLIILILALLVRLYDINRAVADWHAWRQADTAAVARLFYEDGFNPFKPRYFDMSVISQAGTYNLNHYFFVEFPIYESLVYVSYVINRGVNVELARLVSVIFSLGSVVFIYFIVSKFWTKTNALLSALLFAVLPFNIFYSRVVLPEPSLIFFCLGMFYFTYRWIFEDKLWLFITSVCFTAAAFLTKPFALIYLLPLLYPYFQKERKIWPVPKRYFLWVIFSFLPFFAWRIWASKFPDSIPDYSWQFNRDGIRLKPAFWRWIIEDRLDREILSSVGVFFLGLGLIIKNKTNKDFTLYLLALTSLLYLIIVATGNVKHDYYQVEIIPAIVIFTSRGIYYMLTGLPSLVSRIFTLPLAVFLVGLMLYLTWNEVKGLYQINNDTIVVAGEEADRILPKDAKVAAPLDGDTSFLYYVNRPGFPHLYAPLDVMINQFGITDYVSVNYDEQTNDILNHYQVIEKTPKFVIVDLTKKIN